MKIRTFESATTHGPISVTVLDLEGRFDAQEAPTIAAWLDEVISEGARNIVVNLHEVKFIDSVGLAILVRGLKRCRQGSGDLKLCALQQPIRVILELTRLDKAFEMFTDEASAVQAFQRQ